MRAAAAIALFAILGCVHGAPHAPEPEVVEHLVGDPFAVPHTAWAASGAFAPLLWDVPADKAVEIRNPLPRAVHVDVWCSGVLMPVATLPCPNEWSGMIPPLSQRRFMIRVSGKFSRQQACEVAMWE